MPPEDHKKRIGEQTRKKKEHFVSREEVARIAALAKLFLTPKEEEKFSLELSAILDYFKVIDEANVNELRSTYVSQVSTTNVFRGDGVVATDPESILVGVPKRKGRYVKAPRVS